MEYFRLSFGYSIEYPKYINMYKVLHTYICINIYMYIYAYILKTLFAVVES